MREFVFFLFVGSLLLSSCSYHDVAMKTRVDDHYLPLEIGNWWDFQSMSGLTGLPSVIITHREVIDIATINNHLYYLLVSTSTPVNGNQAFKDSAYYRIDTEGYVYIFRKSMPGFEDKWFKLNANNGDNWTYSVSAIGSAHITTTVKSLLIGSTAVQQCKSFYYNVNTMSDEEHTITLAPGIGFAEEYSNAWGMGEVLKSARIHGEVHNF